MDDSPRDLAILRRILGGEFQLETAESGEEALEIAPGFRPDLVLLDVMMPGIDGYETCRRMRRRGELAGTKVIIVSAMSTTAERLEGYAAGADDYLGKPFDPDEMLAKVRVYLRLKTVEEMDRLKSDLLSLLSHETGTPLTSIMGPVLLLKDMPDITEEQRRMLDMIESGARRLHGLVEKILLLAQLRARALPFKVATHDLGKIARTAIESQRVRAEQAQVRVVFQGESGVAVKCDAQYLGHSLEALLDNAIRVSPAGAAVEVRSSWTGHDALIEVADHGLGIAAEVLPRVFEEFVVADVRHHSRGHGLSLATVRAILDQLGGRISVISAPGQGACFSIQLPGPAAATQRVAA